MNQTLKRNLVSLVGLIVLIVLAIGSTDTNQRTSSSNGTSGNSTSQESPKEVALRSVKLDWKWGTAGFGNIMEADFTIDNPTQYKIKDLEITCRHFAKSGTEIDSNTRTIYDFVEPKSKKVIKKFNMGFIHSQAEKSSCKIADLEIVQ
jgi:hypothetical protein